MQDLAIKLVQFLGLAVNFHPQAAGGLVDPVDRLIGQKPVGDIAVRQRRRRHKRRVGNPHAVVQLVFLFDAAQNRDGVFNRGFLHHHRLKPTRQSCVFFDIFAVFIQRGRADAMQLAAGKCGFDQIGGIHGAIGFAGTNQRVHLVDEQNDIALGRGHLVQHRL